MKIRTRISLWITVTGVLASLVLSLIVFLELIEEPYEMLDNGLYSYAQALSENMHFLNIGSTEPGKPYSTPYWIKIMDGEGKNILYVSEIVKKVDLPLKKNIQRYTVDTNLSLNQFWVNKDADEDSASFRVLIYRFSQEGQKYLMQIGGPVENLKDEAIELITTIGGGLFASALLLILASYYVSSRILRPVNRIKDIVQAFNEKTLDQRIPLGKEQDELYELSTSLNDMFDRLQFSFFRQKEFIANASHEFKTPVTLLRLSLADILHEEELSEVLRDRLARQNKTILRLYRLIKNLLSLSTLELSDSLNREEFVLNDIAASVLEDFQPIMRQRRFQCLYQADEPLLIYADKEKLKRVLINLIENSIKYNRNGGEVRLTICRGEQKGVLLLELFNTGCGIPVDDYERIFDQFYRVEKSRSTALGGVGLGLTISKRIIELHSGSISVQSEAGSWAQFSVRLPILSIDS